MGTDGDMIDMIDVWMGMEMVSGHSSCPPASATGSRPTSSLIQSSTVRTRRFSRDTNKARPEDCEAFWSTNRSGPDPEQRRLPQVSLRRQKGSMAVPASQSGTL